MTALKRQLGAMCNDGREHHGSMCTCILEHRYGLGNARIGVNRRCNFKKTGWAGQCCVIIISLPNQSCT